MKEEMHRDRGLFGRPVTTKTKVKGVRFGCGCTSMSLIGKRIALLLLPSRCPEHDREIVALIDRRK